MLGYKTPPTVIQYPSGNWGFVGDVPAVLAYTDGDGNPPTARQLDIARHCGPGFASLKTRSWPTREAALLALEAWQNSHRLLEEVLHEHA